MAKKATLLKRAQKLGLEVTNENTVPEINAALEAHAAADKVETPTPEPTTPPEAPEQPQNDKAGVSVEMTLEAPQNEEYTLKQVLLAYNSINKSRRRWVMNRNLLRNHWKELFELLEKASGRDGGKAGVFDPNWHEVVDKGVVTGAADRAADDIQVPAMLHDEVRVFELETELAETKAQLQAALEAKEIATKGTVGEGEKEETPEL